MNASIIKKTYVMIIPIILLIMLISFGICVLLGDNSFSTVTYLSKHTTYFMGQNITTYDYDLQSYVANLTTTRYITNIKRLFDISWFQKIKDLISKPSGYKATGWRVILDVAKSILLGIGVLLNGIIMILNILLVMPLQLIVIILLHIFSLVGLNMGSNWWLPKSLKWINQNFYIPNVTF